MKGVILCGGKGTRLRPATLITNKHLLPILSEPMIMYPLRTLISLGVTDILLVTGGEHIGAFADFLGSGKQFGVSLTYRVQEEAGGIAEALSLAEGFYSGYDGHVIAILGDNVYAPTFSDVVKKTLPFISDQAAAVFLKKVPDLERFGVATLSPFRNLPYFIDSVVEKPKNPPVKGLAVTGFYIYPSDVFDVIKTIKPSSRGELEITDVTNHYVKNGICHGIVYNNFWSDAGTVESLLEVNKWAFQQTKTHSSL